MSGSAPAEQESGKAYSPLLLVVIFGDIALYGFISNIRGVSYPLIKNSFNASYSQQGLMTALLSFTGVCFCVIPGLFMRRFGLKKTILAGFCVLILGMSAIYFAGSFFAAAAMLMILSAGFGFLEIGINGMGVRIFTVRSAFMMTLLHFFFGVGSVCGPRFAALIIKNFNTSWQAIYPFALIPLFVILVINLIATFPGKMKAEDEGPPPDQIPFFTALKEPLVWIFGLIMGLISAIEACCIAWSGLYFQDVFGIDSGTGVFVSMFFVMYTVARFFSGFLAEKLGYMKLTLGACFVVPLVLLAGFLMGKPGYYFLPAAGIFIAPVYPTMLATSVIAFGKKAQAMSPAIISISFSLVGIIQLGFGLSNRFLGAAWAFRSCVIYGVLVFLLALKLSSVLKGREEKTSGAVR